MSTANYGRIVLDVTIFYRFCLDNTDADKAASLAYYHYGSFSPQVVCQADSGRFR